MAAVVAAGEDHRLCLSQVDERFLQFQKLGFLVYGTSYFLVVIPFDNRGTLFYREQWYMTPGDSDLI